MSILDQFSAPTSSAHSSSLGQISTLCSLLSHGGTETQYWVWVFKIACTAFIIHSLWQKEDILCSINTLGTKFEDTPLKLADSLPKAVLAFFSWRMYGVLSCGIVKTFCMRNHMRWTGPGRRLPQEKNYHCGIYISKCSHKNYCTVAIAAWYVTIVYVKGTIMRYTVLVTQETVNREGACTINTRPLVRLLHGLT